MTQKVSSRSVASASCSALRTERSQILRRITGGQPTITRLVGKMSVIPLTIQTGMPDRCMEGRLAKENPTPCGGTKNPGGPSGFQGTGNRTPSGWGGQPGGQKKSKLHPRYRTSKSRPNPRIRRKQRKCPKIPGQGQGKPVLGLSFRQGQGAWRRWRSLIRRPWPWKGQSSCGSGVRCRSIFR